MLCKRIINTRAFQQTKTLKQVGIRTFASTPSFEFREKDRLHEGKHFSAIPHRSLIELEGVDVSKFLQGLITNHMPKISSGGDGFYTAFLTPQGRMMQDTFIYPVNVGNEFTQPKYMMDVPINAKDTILRHMKRYILRSKVKMRDCSEEYKLWHIWGHEQTKKRLSDIGCLDPRIHGFGYRALFRTDQDVKHTLNQNGDFEQLDSKEYTIRRILHGVPEGTDDIWPEVSLPLESNFDYMGGVDFHKGCYIGQELTIRTFHTGVVRKRIVPVQIYKDKSIPKEQSVDRTCNYLELSQKDIKLADNSSKRAVGKMGSSIHNIGLALMRLEHVEKFQKGENVEFTLDNIRLAPFLPEWWSAQEPK